MTTEQIAEKLKLTAQLQELHGENAFKVRALANAAYRLDKTDINLEGKNPEELAAIEGIGKGIAAKIYGYNGIFIYQKFYGIGASILYMIFHRAGRCGKHYGKAY